MAADGLPEPQGSTEAPGQTSSSFSAGDSSANADLHTPQPTRPGQGSGAAQSIGESSSLSKGNTSPLLAGPSSSHSQQSLAKPSQHRHSRSRSVNLAISAASPEAPSAINLDLDNVRDMRRHSGMSPNSFSNAVKHPVGSDTSHHASPSSPSTSNHSLASASSPSFPPYRSLAAENQSQRSMSRSPELRRPSHFPHDRNLLAPGSHDPHHFPSSSSSSSRSRNASPARMYALPPSPRLQAFGSNRDRRTSGSSSGSGTGSAEATLTHGSPQSGSSSPPLTHRGQSPGPLPASPRAMALPLPVNPDPEHPFDSVWPTSSTPSPSSSPRGREGGHLHHWMLNREGSSSPILRPTARVGSPVGIPPASRHLRASGPGSSPIAVMGGHFGKGHARSFSGPGNAIYGRSGNHHHTLSNSSSSSSPSSASSPPLISPSTSPAREASIPHERSEGSPHGKGPSTSGSQADAGQLPNLVTSSQSQLSSALLSPATSSVKVDAHNAHSHAHAIGSATQSDENGHQVDDLERRTTDARSPPSLPRRISTGELAPSTSSTSPVMRVKSPFTANLRKSPGPPTSPIQQVALGESPPKTRSFIGMPPRSGYDLSDDPDDVGSEDGASVSSGKDSASTVDEDDHYMEEDDSSYDRSHDSGSHDEEQQEGHAGSQDNAGSEEFELNRARESNGWEENPQTDNPSEQPLSSSADKDDAQAGVARPALPKRPSLTRNSGVPPVPALLPQPNGTHASNPLRYFDDEANKGPESIPDIDVSDDVSAQALSSEASTPEGIVPSPENASLPGAADLEGPDASEHPNAAAASAAVAAEMEQPEESLSTLERIFLFAKSEMTYHRVIVSRSLPAWIREVELSEAVEYVVALLNGLATDEADVCAAFATELHHIMWHFYQNCPLTELQTEPSNAHETKDQSEKSEPEKAIRPRIPVGIFTPLICALLLNQHALVANTAQNSLVSFCRRLRGLPPLPDESSLSLEDDNLDCLVTHAEGREGERVEYEKYEFDEAAKAVVLAELLDHVAFAMGQPNQERSADESHQHANESEAQPEDEEMDHQVEEADTSPATTATAAAESEAETSESASQESAPAPQSSANNSDADVGGLVGERNDDVGGLVGENDDSSWDAAMQDESQVIDVWRKDGSPFDTSSPAFSSNERADVDEEAAIGRMASVGLLGALSAEDAVSSDIVRERFVPEIVALREDSAFYVRKEAAVALAPLSKHLSDEDVSGELLPLFDAFCEDKIWHVRQAACSSLPAIFKKVQGEVRRSKVVNLLRSFSSDVSRNVRTAALEIIGEVIYLFDGEEAGVPEELVRFFLGEPFDGPAAATGSESANDEPTPSPGSGSFLFADFGFGAAMNGSHSRKESHWGTDFMQFNDPERPLVVAYNFPAVLLTLKGEAWPRLRSLHLDLISQGTDKVRQSLAASLHEVAKLIGSEATEKDLLPLFEHLMANDSNMEVRGAALENVHITLAQVSKQSAVEMVTRLKDMWSQNFAFNWRLRESLANQVPQLAGFLVLEDEEGSLMSIMQTALSDPISSVREAGVRAAPSLYHNFAEHDQTIADGVLGMLADMGESQAYRVRVGFLLAADALVASRIQRSSFQLIVLPRLVALAEDPVVDVRMALAKVVSSMCQLDELFASPQSRSVELVDLLHRLAQDSCQHVRNRVVHLLDPEDPVLQMEPHRASDGRRELTLGPADGGPHKPEVSSFSMDYEPGDGGENEPFSMDEDDGEEGLDHQGSLGGDHDDDAGAGAGFGNSRHGDVFMSEHDMDSDLEMVNMDEAADPPMSDENGQDPMDTNGRQDPSSTRYHFDSFGSDSDSDAPHHLLNVGGGDSEDDDSFEREFKGLTPTGRLDSMGAGAGRGTGGLLANGWLASPGSEREAIGSSLLSLTSPERSREAWMDHSSEASGSDEQRLQQQRRTNGHRALVEGDDGGGEQLADTSVGIGAGNSGDHDDDEDVHSSPLSRKSGPKRPSSGGGDQRQQSRSTPGAADPFLSFVSGELGQRE